jgi:hypothetical protein
MLQYGASQGPRYAIEPATARPPWQVSPRILAQQISCIPQALVQDDDASLAPFAQLAAHCDDDIGGTKRMHAPRKLQLSLTVA